MAKITKHAAFLDTLHSMVTKEASGSEKLQQPNSQHAESVSAKTEHVNKNKEGHPEHNPQEFKQTPASEPSDPTKTHHKKADEVEAEKTAAPAEKTAEKSEAAKQMPSTALSEKATAVEAPNEVKQEKSAAEQPSNEKLAALGAQLLATIESMNKEASSVANNTGAGKISGTPGGDTHPEKVSDKTEHVNKNEHGHPEKNPQDFHQKPGEDPTKHKKTAEEAEEAEKQASFELGRQFARSFLISKKASESSMYKEAGRRDFESLIASASAELEKESKVANVVEAKPVAAKTVVNEKKAADETAELVQIKQAEEAGAAAFQELYKQAQEAEAVNQIKLAHEQQLQAVWNQKVAAEKQAAELAAKLAAHEAEMQKKAEDEKLDAKLAQWGRYVVEDIMSKLKSEPAR